MFCGKCGAEVPDGYEFCMKCGAKIEQKQEDAIETPKKKNRKWLIPVIAIVVVAILAVVAIYFFKDAQKKNGLYDNIAWGTSYDDIKEMVEKRNGEDEILTGKDKSVVYETLNDYEGDSDISAMVIYDCQDDGTLHNVTLLITNGDDSKYTDEKLYDKYEKELIDLYGDSEDDIIGDKWTTKNSQISLVYFSDGMLIKEYEDINTVED